MIFKRALLKFSISSIVPATEDMSSHKIPIINPTLTTAGILVLLEATITLEQFHKKEHLEQSLKQTLQANWITDSVLK